MTTTPSGPVPPPDPRFAYAPAVPPPDPRFTRTPQPVPPQPVPPQGWRPQGGWQSAPGAPAAPPGYPQPLPTPYGYAHSYGYAPPGHPAYGYPQPAPPYGYLQTGHPQGGSLGSAPSDPVHWLLPVGRTWQSIAGGYVALFAVVFWVLGPVALGLGLAALRASSVNGRHGRGRAWFAVVIGSLSTFAAVAAAASWLAG